ncbi:JAB domain-containing protein [Romeriopsis navalis]|nr:JAB domain-containing protein [Romeriopsis navalis]
MEASPEDIALTRSLIKVTKLVDIDLLGHLIVTQESFTRLRDATNGIWV